MNNCIKTCLISVLVFVVAVMFSGCSLTSNKGGNGGLPNITTGILVNDKEKKESDEKFEDAKIDVSKMHEALLGIKVAYDGSENTLNALNNDKFYQTYEKVVASYKNGKVIDYAKFVKENPALELDETFVSQVVWIYNYVNQYQTLARLILVEIAKNYGLGIDEGLVVDNGMYGQVEYEEYPIPDPTDYSSVKNSINVNVVETTNTISVENLWKGEGEAYYSGVDFNNSDEFEIIMDSVPNRIMPFLLNLNQQNYSLTFEIDNMYYDPDNIVNQENITDPDGNLIPNPKYIPNHILGMQKLVLQATTDIDSGVDADNCYSMKYSIDVDGSATPDPTPTLSANAYAMDYVEAYTNILALRLLEKHILTENTFSNEIDSVSYITLIEHYAEWLTTREKIGFESGYVDADENIHNIVEDFASVVNEYVVGNQVIAFDENMNKGINDTIRQIVYDSVNAKVRENDNDNYMLDNDNGKTYFKVVNCIEYKDYTTEELYGETEKSANANSVSPKGLYAKQSGEFVMPESDKEHKLFVLPEQNYYSIVVMIKPNIEPQLFRCIIPLFISSRTDINVDLGFRYVVSGEEKIFSEIDYLANVNEGENGFTGRIEKNESDNLTLEMLDKSALIIDDTDIPQLDTVKNREILISKFKNNYATTFARSQNISDLGYSYNSELNYYYFNETSNNCDYVEINLRRYKDLEETSQEKLCFYLSLFDLLLETAS